MNWNKLSWNKVEKKDSGLECIYDLKKRNKEIYYL